MVEKVTLTEAIGIEEVARETAGTERGRGITGGTAEHQTGGADPKYAQVARLTLGTEGSV